jgi:hypothetical protein
MQMTNAAPALSDARDANNVVDEIISKLKQLRQQSEGKKESSHIFFVIKKRKTLMGYLNLVTAKV